MMRFAAPLSGLFIFALASGYLMTLIPLKINTSLGSDVIAGYMGSIYYFGLLAGSFRADKLVSRVGHIRAFAVFMSLLCASVLGLAIFDSTFAWLCLRFLNGLTIAGIFVVVESWLLCESEEGSRGKVLAFYMISLYGANAAGQLFVGVIDGDTLIPFIAVGALLALAILPPSLTKMPSPSLEKPSTLSFVKLYRLTPSAMIGCLAGGLILGALYSLLPIYILNREAEGYSVSLLMGITMAGGMLLQYPVGYFSDYVDRRKVLVMISFIACICCLLFIWYSDEFWLRMILLFLIGGSTFTLYPLAISHGCDHLEPEDIVSGTQGLLLSYSGGSCIGPIIGAYFMGSSSYGLMIYFALISGLVGVFFLVRIPVRPAIYSSDDQPFVPVTRTSPVIAQIDPRGGDNE